MKKKSNKNSTKQKLILLFIFLGGFYSGFGITKTSVSSGAWGNVAVWSPSGVPTANDDVVIASGNSVNVSADASVKSVTVNAGANLNWSQQRKLTINGNFIVNGTADLSLGNINQQMQGAAFAIGNNASFTWNPDDNTSAGASLFIKSIENFSASGLLVVKKWYSFTSVPLGQVVTGNFGSVTISTLVGNTLFAWNQQNQFEQHKILGTLTIENGWVILDTTGNISNTQIGNIVLDGVNSFLDLHAGNHPSSFTVSTNSITNNSGELSGIYNGNGDVTLSVTGNFTNSGHAVLIYNTGVQSIGNGNAKLNVGGSYSQASGDMRGIFNLSGTASGSAELNFGSLSHTGGVMMAYYACNSSNATCKINVTGNALLNFSNANDKFRINGLTTLWGHYSNAKSELHVGGNFTLAGLASAEFTSSGSVGSEKVIVDGNILISGLTNNFNYGSHATEFVVGGNIEVSGGKTCLSKSPGTLNAVVNNDIIISSGTFSVKGSTGTTITSVNRNYIQTGGNFLLHDNNATPTSDIISITINGIFSQLNGILNFDNNNSSAATHEIILKGTQCNLGGNGIITRAGGTSSTVFGILKYATQGVLSYSRNATTHLIEQVKQIVAGGCTVDVVSGNVQVTSHSSKSNDFLKIQNGATLQMHQSQIVSNTKAQYCGIKVEAGGEISTQNQNGFYNEAGTATVSNIDFVLDANSVVEYNGNATQKLSGGSEAHEYGILKINFSNPAESVKLNGSVAVRTKLILENGELNLNGKKLIIKNASPDAILRNNGFIKSDISQGAIEWENISIGIFEFPFGNSNTNYVPVILKPISGIGNAKVNSWHTDVSNQPMPQGISEIRFAGQNIANADVADRWFYINAPGIKADVTLNFSQEENSPATALQNSKLSVLAWENNSFRQLNTIGNKVNSANIKNCSTFSYWTISAKQPLVFAPYFYSFDASYQNNNAQLDWVFDGEQAGDIYQIERSADADVFKKLSTVESDGSASYDFTDNEPLKGISFYRVKQFNANGTYKYSDTRQINTDGSEAVAQLDFIKVVPNPFNQLLSIDYFSGLAGTTQIELISNIGQTIFSEKQKSVQGRNHFEYAKGKHLPPGTYVLSLKAHGTRISRKLLKK